MGRNNQLLVSEAGRDELMIFERTFAYAGENLSEIWTGIAILPGWHSGHSDTPPRRRVVVLITTHMAEMCTEKRRDAPSCMQKKYLPS